MVWLLFGLYCIPVLVCAGATALFADTLRDELAEDGPGRRWRRLAPSASLLALSAAGFLITLAPALGVLLEVLR